MICVISQRIMATYPENVFGKKISEVDPELWSQEGFKNAVNYVYSTPENQVVSDSYVNQGKRLVDEQLALAGYRLATLLNELFG